MEQKAVLWNRKFILCICNNLFLFIYYYAMLTILPIYILQDLGGTVKEAGLALTLFLLSSIAIRPFSGLIVEKLGKRWCLRGAGGLFVLFALCYWWIDSLFSLLLVRFLHGFWFSILTTVNVPVVSDFIPDARKGEGMGYFVMATNLGVVFGPLIALSAIHFMSFKLLFGILAIVTAIGYIFTLTLNVQETEVQKHNVSQNVKPVWSWQNLIEKRVLPIGSVALLTAFAYASVSSFITAFAQQRQLLAYASVFFIVFAGSMIIVRPWVGKRYDQKGPNSVIYPSFVLFAIGLVIVGLSENQWVLWLSAIFIGIGYGSLFPCMQTLAIQSVEKHRMGYAISTYFTLFDIGLAGGSIFMGYLIAYADYSMTYWFCAVIVLATLSVYHYKVAPVVRLKGAHDGA